MRFVDDSQAGWIACELTDAFDLRTIPKVNPMDHLRFGAISEAPRGWSGAVQIGFFSGFDDVASALLAEKFGGAIIAKRQTKATNRGASS